MVLPCVNSSLVGISLYRSFHRLPAILGGVLILAAALFPSANIASAQGNAGTCSTGGAVADVANNPGLVSDCEALLAARDTLAGNATLNWSADKPMTEWEGVIFAGSPPRVIALDLSARGLTGELPTETGETEQPVENFALGKQHIRDGPDFAKWFVEIGSVGPRRQPTDREHTAGTWQSDLLTRAAAQSK